MIFVASIECSESATLNGKNIFATTFKLCGSSWSGYYLLMEVASCHKLSPIYSNKNKRCSHFTLFSLYVDQFSLPTTYWTVLHTSYSWINSLKLLHDDSSTGFIFTEMVLNLCSTRYMYLLGFNQVRSLFDCASAWRNIRSWLAADNVLGKWKQFFEISHSSAMY